MITDIEKLIKDYKRMCDTIISSGGTCDDCPLNNITPCRSIDNLEEIAPIVVKWAEEHPEKADNRKEFAMNFTIDDMIEFCKSECDYHTKKSDEKLKLFIGNGLDRDSYMLGNSIGFKIAYENMLESLIKLKENQNERN